MRPRSFFVVLVWLAQANVVLASGFMASKMGGDLSGPTEDNAAAIFWNPAAIGPIEGMSVFLDGNSIWRTQRFERSWPATYDPGAREADPGTMRAFAFQPMAAVTARPGLDWLTIGAAFYAPYGHRSDWPDWDIDAEREKEIEDQAAPSQAFHSLLGGIRAMYFTPAFSFRVLDWLWLGGGVSMVYAEVDSLRARDWAPDLEAVLGIELERETVEHSGLAGMDFTGYGWAWSLGVFARPWHFLRFGLSFTSGTSLDLEGRTWLTLPPPFLTLLYGERVDSDARLSMELPPALRFGIQWDILDWLVFRVHSEVVFWSVYEQVRIHELAFENEHGPVTGDLGEVTEFVSRRDYVDTVDVRAGFRFFPVPWWMLFVGGGFDSCAAPEKNNTPDLYDAPKFGLAGGTRIQLIPLLEWIMGAELDRDDRLALTVGFTWVHYLQYTVDESQADPPIDGVHHSEAYLLNTNLEARFF
ncbi:MAG: outer membrane protein transport protein [Deltaproteobacteria bacterium]|nr:outer membrane protein transport protein [Deltaproteobacteria bacterium]